MSYIREQRQASNFVNGESFTRFTFFETYFWIKFESSTFFISYIATRLKWQSSCGWHNSYHWCLRGRTISVIFSIDSVLDLIWEVYQTFIQNRFSCTSKIARGVEMKKSYSINKAHTTKEKQNGVESKGSSSKVHRHNTKDKQNGVETQGSTVICIYLSCTRCFIIK